MRDWIVSGHLTYNGQNVEGLESDVSGLKDVFDCKNFGKYVLKVRLIE